MKIACPRCGADVVFDPTTGKCFCEYCGSSIDISEFELNQYEKAKQQVQYEQQYQTPIDNTSETFQNPEELYDEFHCSSCGARLITDKTTTITRCVFCGSQQMIKQRMTGKFEPKEVLPFKINKEKFVNIYNTFIKKRMLAPEEFRKNPGVAETRGLYVPYHLFQYHLNTYGRGLAQYTQGKSTYSKWFEYSLSEDCLVPVDGSVKLDDNIMASLEPFNVNQLVPFNPAYITGFQSECTDETEESLAKKSEDRVFAQSVSTINNSLGNYNHKTGVLRADLNKLGEAKYVLLPVWFLNTWYKNKKYSYAVNGDTGKVVGEIPLSKPKFLTVMTFLTGVALALTLLILAGYSESRSRRRSSSDDDGPGTILVMIWGGGVLGPYAYIKKKYKNISHVFEKSLPYSNRQFVLKNDFKRKKDYTEKFPNDGNKDIVYQKFENGEFIQNVDFEQMLKDVKAIKNRDISINNKNL